MKLKKLSAIAAAAVMAFSALTFTVSADIWTGISFDSADKLAEHIRDNNGNVVNYSYSPAGYRVAEDVDSLWVPAGFSDCIDCINSITFDGEQVSVQFCVRGVTYCLTNYGSGNSGRSFYNSIKNSGASKKVNGRTVYRADNFDFSQYAWKQNGNYFELYVSGRGNDCYALCAAEEYVLPEYSDEGLTNIQGGLYYVEPDGGYYVGWKTLNGKKYFFGMDGRAVTYNTIIGNTRYTFDASGVCTGRYTGWLDKDGYRYYYKNGRYVTGVYKVDNKTYTFSEYGILMY